MPAAVALRELAGWKQQVGWRRFAPQQGRGVWDGTPALILGGYVLLLPLLGLLLW
jgi:hypothetical protein